MPPGARHRFLIVAILLPLSLLALIAATIRTAPVVALDTEILLAFRTAADPAIPLGSPAFTDTVRDVSALGSAVVVVIVAMVIGGLLLTARRKPDAILLWASTLGAILLNDLFKFMFERPRPDIVLGLVRVYSSSFPSGHALWSSAVYLTLAAIAARAVPGPAIRVYAIVVALAMTGLIGIARLYLGVHYPTDVLAGWCVGSSWAAFCLLVARCFDGRRSVP